MERNNRKSGISPFHEKEHDEGDTSENEKDDDNG
jgi:hypothetical protein